MITPNKHRERHKHYHKNEARTEAFIVQYVDIYSYSTLSFEGMQKWGILF